MPRRIVHFKCRVFVVSAVRNHYHNSKECFHQGLVRRVPNDWTTKEESLMSEVCLRKTTPRSLLVAIVDKIIEIVQ
jgi:hypothetical protein